MFYNDNFEELSQSERIPVSLMEPYLNRNHILFTDNYNTSVTSAQFLLQHSTHLVSTIQINRKHYPKELNDIDLERGTATFTKLRNTPRILMSKYRASKDKANKNKKIVFLLSTCHNPYMVNTGKVDSNTNPIFKPSMIADYNRNMGGIDMADQQLLGLHLLRKSYKWYKKLALRLLSQVALNSCKIYCEVTGSKMVFLDYLRDVVTSLITIEEPILGEIV